MFLPEIHICTDTSIFFVVLLWLQRFDKYPSVEEMLSELHPQQWMNMSIRQSQNLHSIAHYVKMKVNVDQLCLTLCDPMDNTVHGILQARILEWVGIPFSRGSSQPRDQTQVSHTAGRFLPSWATREYLVHYVAPTKCKQTGQNFYVSFSMLYLETVVASSGLNKIPNVWSERVKRSQEGENELFANRNIWGGLIN